MDILRLFGVGVGKILAHGCSVQGTVTRVSACWWISVKTQPVRLYASPENTLHPSIITFDYSVGGASYTGKLYIPLRFRVPQKGESIDVYYDPNHPKRYACYAFGPGKHMIGR